MHLRPARSQDLPLIADVAAQAILEDELSHASTSGGKSIVPIMPDFLRRLRGIFLSPGCVIIVAVEYVSPVAENAKVSPLAMEHAVWERIGAGMEVHETMEGGGGDRIMEWFVPSH